MVKAQQIAEGEWAHLNPFRDFFGHLKDPVRPFEHFFSTFLRTSLYED